MYSQGLRLYPKCPLHRLYELRKTSYVCVEYSSGTLITVPEKKLNLFRNCILRLDTGIVSCVPITTVEIQIYLEPLYDRRDGKVALNNAVTVLRRENFLSNYWMAVEIKSTKTLTFLHKRTHDTLDFPPSSRCFLPKPWCTLKNIKLARDYSDFLSDVS
ncbi:hypothetical protein TNIN_241471 [Trichonephila inaurata madagascariensis]|uniref:Uncharacterized protein n=1 Tax=Trichonephila inaurata madagascariensis TaxID=2747483 RepID=A0A8X7C2W7_9ARAC|nr:hypothetical protein TNIN_241471 [Trichonephila inaurata madagascariensis]